MKVFSKEVEGMDCTISGGGVYFHGHLEDLADYDIPECSSFNIDTLKEGIYNVVFNDEIKAKMFYWRSPTRRRGLIVALSDHEYMEDAQTKFDLRKESL